jgi:hypothetical protein
VGAVDEAVREFACRASRRSRPLAPQKKTKKTPEKIHPKKGPSAIAPPLVMFRFETPGDLERWHVSTDAYFGGRSRASLDLAVGGDDGNNRSTLYATFSGRCSTAPTLAQVEEQERKAREEEAAAAESEEERQQQKAKKKKPPTKIAHTSSNAEIARAGYAVVASKVLDLSDPFDLSPYSHLVCTVRGDGGRYLASLRTDSLSGGGGDVWQAPFSSPAGKWADVRLPLAAFALTHRGQLVGRRVDLRADRVLSVGVSFAAAGQDDDGFRRRRRKGGDEESGGDDDDDANDDGLAFRLDLREIRAEADEAE